MMSVAFIADFSSPIARQWIAGVAAQGVDAHVLSTVAWDGSADEAIRSVRTVAVPLDSTLRMVRRRRPAGRPGLDSGGGAVNLGELRRRATPTLVRFMRSKVRRALDRLRPELVHALRIPLEGMVAAKALGPSLPLVVSVWGNDLTWQAATYPGQDRLTRTTLGRASGLLADCERDRNLANDWGFDGAKPSLVLPGAGGVDMSLFHSGPPSAEFMNRYGRAIQGGPVVFDPRGIRHYVRTAELFQALPQVIEAHPAVHFLFAGMRDNSSAESTVTRLGLTRHVTLLPHLTRAEMAEAFRCATVSVSVSDHDGTPNSLQEAMATGCIPVVGRLESVAEWITHGLNGLLCDPRDPQSIAAQLSEALTNQVLRAAAQDMNPRIIEERAEYRASTARAVEFYREVIDSVHDNT